MEGEVGLYRYSGFDLKHGVDRVCVCVVGV